MTTNVVVDSQSSSPKFISAPHSSHFCRAFRLVDFSIGFVSSPFHCRLWHPPHSCRSLAPALLPSPSSPLSASASGSPRSTLSIATSAMSFLPHAVLDVRLPSPIFLACSAALALALRPQPMAGVIDGFRWAITGRGQPPSLILLASSASSLSSSRGLFFFNRMESSVADRV